MLFFSSYDLLSHYHSHLITPLVSYTNFNEELH